MKGLLTNKRDINKEKIIRDKSREDTLQSQYLLDPTPRNIE